MYDRIDFRHPVKFGGWGWPLPGSSQWNVTEDICQSEKEAVRTQYMFCSLALVMVEELPSRCLSEGAVEQTCPLPCGGHGFEQVINAIA